MKKRSALSFGILFAALFMGAIVGCAYPTTTPTPVPSPVPELVPPSSTTSSEPELVLTPSTAGSEPGLVPAPSTTSSVPEKGYTITIAPYDSSADVSEVDYLLDGDRDNVEIQEAINSLNVTGGQIKVLEGTVIVDQEIIIEHNNISLEGSNTVWKPKLYEEQNLVNDSGIATLLNVAESSNFVVGQSVWIRDDDTYENASDYRHIVSIPDDTTIEIDSSTSKNWVVAEGARIVGLCRYISIQDESEVNPIRNTTITGFVFEGNADKMTSSGSWHVPMINLRNTSGAIIDNCYFRNGRTCAVFFSGAGGDLTNCHFYNFVDKNSSNKYDVIHSGSGTQTYHYVIIEGNFFEEISAESVIFLCMNIKREIIVNNIIYCTDKCNYGVNINHHGHQWAIIANNQIIGPNRGIDDLGQYNLIEGNVIRDCSDCGLRLRGNRGIARSNLIYNCATRGVEVIGNYYTIQGNLITGCNKGIRMNGTNYCIVTDNNLQNNTGGGMEFNETNIDNTIRDNKGYTTENCGAASISFGATNEVVSHGLDDVPTIINIAFTEQAKNDYGTWWISDINGRTFTLNVSSEPGASNLDFWWEAKVR